MDVPHISGGCLNEALQARSEFRRTSRLQGAPFLSPVSFGKTKEIGSPPRDKRPLQANTQQKQKTIATHAVPTSDRAKKH
ncbi:hypothetical protein [Comamonas aquatica]|uniref:hypothetical protein n=1 Tax=Comamonas aquatica TaxID=225991 RepID=UPI00244D1244|nr:hypothetical protein [Comamonas aquatica]MDH0380783.1 hypothetical protein [Comamonas aquatica]MDH0428559.1 hypothetical protein [Comamonas aquatica]MDH0940382.1 hypothetical protein [Comamonas aquatica]